jgi:hypothetical protein
MPARELCWLALALALTSGACATTSYDRGLYQDSRVRYRVGELGDAWRPVRVDGGDVAFHRAGMGTISVNSTCTEYEDVPPSALLNHLLFETTERRFLTEEVVPLDGRSARHVVVQLELDGVPVEVELFLLKKDGCVFDLTHVRTPTAPRAARESFVEFVQRFRVLEVRRNG